MNYGLIEDTLHAHEKALDPEHLDAMGMWALALSWCRAYAKDGRVPPALPTRLAGGKRRGRKLAARLVAIRLWDVDGEGWRFHDWSEFYGPDLPSETQNDLPPPPPEPQHGEALSKGAERTRRWRENRTRKDVTGVTNNVTSVTNTVTGDVTRDVGRDGVTRHGDASRVSLFF